VGFFPTKTPKKYARDGAPKKANLLPPVKMTGEKWRQVGQLKKKSNDQPRRQQNKKKGVTRREVWKIAVRVSQGQIL